MGKRFCIMKWNLEKLFFDSRDYQKEMNRLKQDIEKYQHKERKISEIFPDLIEKIWEWKSRLGKLEVYANLTYYQNITSSFFIERKKALEIFKLTMLEKINRFENTILCYEQEEVFQFLKKNPEFFIYLRYIEQFYFNQSDNILFQENFNTLQALILDYNSLRNQMEFGTIIVDGETVPLRFQNLRTYQIHDDRNVRKCVFEQVMKSFHNKKDVMYSYLQKIFQQRKFMSNKKNSSIRSMELLKSELSEEFYFHLIDSCHRHISLLQKYLSLKLSSFSDHCSYDLALPIQKDMICSFSIQEAMELISQSVKVLGSCYESALQECIDSGHIDTIISEEKHPTIVFTWYGYSFLQFRESFVDVKNLSHEIGHMMNDIFSIQELPFVYAISSDFIGEIAAIVNETLLLRYLILTAKTKEEKIFYLSKEIENYVSSVFRPMMFQEFEDYLTEFISSVSYEECCDFYEKLLFTYYGDCICNRKDLREEWLQYDKYYRVSYYSYTYASGKLLSNLIVHNLMNGTLSSEDYLKFLKSGNAKSVLELFNLLHISFDDTTLFDQGFVFLSEDLSLLESLLT